MRPNRAWGTGPEGQRIADLGNGTYRNPVLSGDFPDPTVLKDGEDYYLTTSSFDASPGLLIHHSRDLVNWAPLTFALPRPLTTVFAVDLVKHQGRYFIYIPFIPSPWALEFGPVPRIFVIHADRIEGPWSEPVDLGITAAIDPGTARTRWRSPCPGPGPARTADCCCSSTARCTSAWAGTAPR